MNHRKVLNLSMNFGCGCNCKSCLTKYLPACSQVLLEDMIDWDTFEKVLDLCDIEEVRVIGGDDPLKNCNGHLSFFLKLQRIVRTEHKTQLTAVQGYKVTTITQIAAAFNRLYVRMPALDECILPANTTWIRSFTQVVPYIVMDKVREVDVDYARRSFFPKPMIVTTVGSDIKELRQEYPDIEFRCELFSKRSRMYSLAENRLYNTTFMRNWCKPYTEILREKRSTENLIYEEKNK